MLDMEAIKNFSIDKSGWKKVKFGDVVFEPKDSVKDPVAEGIEHVVGLEHIESENIHLRRSASIEGSTTFTKKFSQGDVLFGRRRAYLKKAAKASFEGICSGDITVMRAKEEVLLPALLPFIINNDQFFDYSITHSAGGLSPRVKFKDLKNYEFNLPTKNIQMKLAELFWSMDSLIRSKGDQIESIDIFKMAKMKSLLSEGIGHSDFKDSMLGKIPVSWEVGMLEDYCDEIFLGLTSKVDYVDSGGYPLIRAKDFNKGTLDFSEVKFISEEQHSKLTKNRKTKIGDILVSKSGSLGTCAIVDTDREFSTYESVITLQPTKSILDNNFLLQILTSTAFQNKMITKKVGGIVGHLNLLTFRKNLIPLPPIEEQYLISRALLQIESTRRELELSLSSSIKLQKSLVQKVF